MDNELLYLVDLSKIEFSEQDGKKASWIQALAPGEYKHPVYGTLQITADKIKNLAESVKTKVRGIDPSINYQHLGDGEAAGWVKDAESRPDGLWVFVEWTTDAARKISEKAFRYFSAEFHDKWEDPTGKKFTDVLFGGALTNRPYMKNLIPVNLSEATVGMAYELVEAINNAKANANKGEEVQVDLAELVKTLGLPAGTTEADALKKLAELTAGTGDNDGDKSKFPKIPATPGPSAELVALAEENPLVAGLLTQLTEQDTALKAFREGLLESAISKQLAEFDQSKIVLTPRAKDMVHDLLLVMPVELHESFWDIMKSMRASSGLMVELGERAGAHVQYGRSKDKVSLFMDEANKLVATQKISLSEAMEQVAKDQPALYAGYRSGSYVGVTE